MKDGSVMGVTHSRSSMLSHCRALTVACNYTEGAFVFILLLNVMCISNMISEGFYNWTWLSILIFSHFSYNSSCSFFSAQRGSYGLCSRLQERRWTLARSPHGKLFLKFFIYSYLPIQLFLNNQASYCTMPINMKSSNLSADISSYTFGLTNLSNIDESSSKLPWTESTRDYHHSSSSSF